MTAAQRLAEYWSGGGRAPRFWAAQRRRVRKAWPMLGQLLDDLAEEVGPDGR